MPTPAVGNIFRILRFSARDPGDAIASTSVFAMFYPVNVSVSALMHTSTGRAFFDGAALVINFLAAAFWVISATRRLTPIRPGLKDLDKVTVLSGDLKTMSTRNAWAAAATGLAVALQIAARYLH